MHISAQCIKNKTKTMAMDHLKQLLILLIILWFVWYFAIPTKNADKPYILQDGTTYGK